MIRFRSFTAVRFAGCLGLVAALAAVGCGGGGGATTLSGNVKLGGAPLMGGTVSVVPQGGSDTTKLGAIIDNGHYYIPNVPVGDVKIAVEGPGKSSDPNAPPATVVVPAKYANPDQSGLTFTLKPGDNKHDIELTP